MDSEQLNEKLRGKLVVLDGPDGCGKTTQTELLVQRLRQQGADVATFRDPGATAIGEKIRRLLLNPQHVAMSTAAEVMLYMAARVQLWDEKIRPALQENKCVVLDRWLSSTCAYQGYAGGFGMDKVIKIARNSLERVWPDLTIILDVDPKVGLSRLNREFDRIEQKGDGYHRKVREGFLELARQQRRFIVVDASGDVEAVQRKVAEAIAQVDL